MSKVYWVEVTKYPRERSEYTRRLTTESFHTAMWNYSAINIGRGYRKRLRSYSPEEGTKVLERAAS